MSVMWVIRILIVIILFATIVIWGYFLKNRDLYRNMLENRIVNVIMVIFYNVLCYSAVLLPSDLTEPIPAIFNHALIVLGFPLIGGVLLILGFCLFIKSIMIRNTVGFEDTSQGLITSGIYHYFRHPIYAGISIISLSLPLIFVSIDGLLISPFIILANILEAKIEEKYDMMQRFHEEYPDYKKNTRIFGPIWSWLILTTSLVILIGISYLNVGG